MDDILSAALGQSGIDLSFLEESASESYDALHISSFPTVVSSRSETIKREEGTSFQAPTPSAMAEEGDNLTDFLDLLSSNEGKAELSDLPHYQLLAGALTESFPCTMPPPNVPLGDEFCGNSDFENVRQRHQSLMSKVRSEPVLNNMPVAYHTQLKGKQLNASNLTNFGDDSKRLNSSLIRQVGSIPLNLKPVLSTAPLPKVVTDNERAAQSLQHMLNAGNLTVKEKHFLLKSAMAKASSFSVSSVVPSDSGDPLASLLSEKVQSSPKVEEDEDDDEEELIHAETFAEYMPTKLQIGLRHPDPVVETSSMASVSPPDIWYDLRLPLDVIDGNLLSALQLEAVVYACQQHEKLLPNGRRAGFLLGDGAGVGKGRTVAGIIYENYLLGRKRGIWLSVSNDLHYDAVRDLRDIGCRVKVHPLNKFKYDEKITSKANGKFKKGVVFSTYSALIGETSGKARFQTRLDQLLHWCGKDYDGVIILDECHKAKNLMPTGSSKPTKTGITVMKLQDMLPKARVVYCSATGASEPKNMAYMNRLGLWGPGTPFREFSDFIQSIEKRGVGAMEMVAMDMKLRGMYIARQLSFTGVTFDIQEVNLCPSFIEVYDAAVRLWLDARQKFEKAAELVGLDSRGKKTMWGQFWSAHQRFFKYLCIACKVKRAVEIAKEAINLGKCVIFGLQSTGEARTLDQLDELGGDLNDFISTTKGVFSTLVEKHFPGSGSGSADEDDKEFKENNAMFMNGVKKRRREWRKNIQMPKRPRRNVNIDANIETMSSSESDENESDTGITFAADEEASARLTGEDSDVGCDSDGDNSFKESSSDSDDEESWLRSVSDRKKPKKPDKSGKTKPKAGTYTDNTSMNVLAAAGFNLGKQYAWANASLSSPVSTENMKSNRTNKITAPHGLSKQLLALPSNRISSDMDRLDQCRSMKANLLEKLEVISQYLPPNTLDQLIDELGGTDYVAEMTGRKGRVVNKEDGSFVYEPRSKDDVPLELLNIAEKKRFMDGSKLIAVISEAASSGISLQADRREKNQRRRVHITLELPWSADKAIQQFGRSHRSNQVSAPEYLFLISELAGEQRFASIVAKRLESLGALTHGDRRATESRDLSRFNFDTKYGRLALDTVLKSVVNQEKPITPLPQSYPGTFMEDVREGLIGVGMTYKDERSGVLSIADKDFTNIARFMNRILGLTVALQNALFQYFTSTLATIVREAKRSGRWDEGIVDIGSQGESVQQVDVKTFTCPAVCGQVKTELVTVSVERGISFKKALEMHSSCIDPTEGFYLSSQLRNGKKTAVLIVRTSNSKKGLYSVFRPNVGLVPRLETLNEINKKYERVDPIDAESNWTEQYEYSESNCVHAFWRGYCKRKLSGLQCEVGTRKRTCHVLCGSVLSVWSKVESLLACLPGPSSKMQIIRVRLDNGAKLVGTLIPSNCAKALCRSLSYEESGEQALW